MEDSNKVQSAPCGGAGDTGNAGICSCAQPNTETFKSVSWIIGSINTPVGVIPQISSQLTF